ncbi:hypothetical protein J805_0703 [Acinetobacter sp. 25977_2]|nr:hypothetical protein J805_0703 [Acinetobacter sp. 25977_2]
MIAFHGESTSATKVILWAHRRYSPLSSNIFVPCALVMLESSLGGITDTILGIDIHPYKVTKIG